MDIFYYDLDGKIYPSQMEAVASGKQCYFYYYDKEFRKVDWTTAPIESLEELYKRRAQYIRDKYQYVILCYSGGYDSTNILETFYYNNIHIDEILLVGAFSQDPETGSDFNHNGDIYHNALPTLKKLNLPNTKITMVDYTQWFNDPKNFTLINLYGNEWSLNTGGFKSVHTLFWYDIKKFVGYDNEKTTAYIMGADKPIFEMRQRLKNGITTIDPCFSINDLQVSDYGGAYSHNNFTRVNFYTSPDSTATDIVRKQIHTLWNFHCNIERMKLFHNIDNVNIANKALYNLKNPLVFESTKSVFSSISHRDMFMLEKKDSSMYNIFVEGLKSINKFGKIHEKYCFAGRPYWMV